MTSTFTIQNIYADSSVLINDTYIKIYNYYFPLGTSKTILYPQIEEIIFHSKEEVNSLWGFSFGHSYDWFSLDQIRKYKNSYIQIVLKSDIIRPCFSPLDGERAFFVLWLNHTKQGKQYRKELQKINKQIIETSLSCYSTKQGIMKHSEMNDSQIQQERKQNKLTQLMNTRFQTYCNETSEMKTSRPLFLDITNIKNNISNIQQIKDQKRKSINEKAIEKHRISGFQSPNKKQASQYTQSFIISLDSLTQEENKKSNSAQNKIDDQDQLQLQFQNLNQQQQQLQEWWCIK